MALAALGEIDLPTEPKVTLRCTLRAWESINALFGSYTEAWRRVQAWDSSAFSTIVAEGAGIESKDAKEIVFKAGLTALSPVLSKYLSMLSNGGKMPVDDDPAAGSKPAGEG